MNYIEKWRKNFGDLKGFILAGHSLGGYLAGHYAVRYPQYIKKLLLLSPIGVRATPEEGTHRGTTRTNDGEEGDIAPWLKPVLDVVWNGKVSPMGEGRFFGQRQTMQHLSDFIKVRFKEIQEEEERQALIDYMYQITMRPGPTDCAVQVMFNSNLSAKCPLGTHDKLASPEFSTPVSFFYGDTDWAAQVEEDAPHKCLKQNKRLHCDQSNYYVVYNSGHSMHMDNPKELASLIIYDVFGEEFTFR